MRRAGGVAGGSSCPRAKPGLRQGRALGLDVVSGCARQQNIAVRVVCGLQTKPPRSSAQLVAALIRKPGRADENRSALAQIAGGVQLSPVCVARAERAYMDYLVELGFEGPGFVAVPNAVVDDERLGADALAVLVYLARLAGGRGARIVRVGAICKRFGLGKDKWQRIARELRAVGALSDNFGRSEDGRNVVRSLVVGWPRPAEPVSRKTRHTGVEACERENPAHTAENPAQVSRKTRLLKRDTERQGRACPLAGEGSPLPGDKAESAAKSARSASSRGETTRAEGGRVAQVPVKAAQDDRAARAAVAASLGLPVRDAVTGAWRRCRELASEQVAT